MVSTSSPTLRLVRTPASAEAQACSDTLLVRAATAPVSSDDASTDRDRLYTEFAPLVRRLIRQYGQDAEMREDLGGEIYCRFCNLLGAFDPTRGIPLRPYMVRQLSMATYTYARHQWRTRKREAAWETEEFHVEQKAAFAPTLDWLAALALDQAASLLPAALAKLPARQRNVIIWRYYEERSFEEIGGLLAILPTTARSLLRHGLNNLRKNIGSTNCF